MAIFDMTEAQAAAQLGVSQRQLARWRKRGKVPFTKDPGGNIGYTHGQLTEIEHQSRYHPEGREPGVIGS